MKSVRWVYRLSRNWGGRLRPGEGETSTPPLGADAVFRLAFEKTLRKSVMIKTSNKIALFFLILFIGHPEMISAEDLNHLPVSAPIDTNSAGRGGIIAVQSVLRIICIQNNSSGTGFLHKSGNLITAAHVVSGCSQPIILQPDGTQITGSVKAADDDVDLALIEPATKINAPALAISMKSDLQIGTQVTTWGYPGGYFGRAPMLSVGYLSGLDARKHNSGKIISQWVVNAAFNSGNSGGPLLQLETGEVIGVVSSKLAPISEQSMTILKALEAQQSGVMYQAKMPDGSTKNISEAQLVGNVLDELRRQIQLVIGYAVLTGDLIAFLQTNGVSP
jgi:S1-C subfamily serine protease